MIVSRHAIFALIFYIFREIEICVSQICDGGCCDGYRLDPDTGKCFQCAPGYYGAECSFLCLYPLYGYRCQLVCLCNVEQCDPIQGCSDLSTHFSPSVPTTSLSEFFHRTQRQEFYIAERTSTNKRITSTTEGEGMSVKSMDKVTSGNSYPYVISIFVLILLLTISYLGNCAYKQLTIRRNVNISSVNTQAHSEANTHSLECDASYAVIDEITHTDNRQMRRIVYKRPALSEDAQTLRIGHGIEETASSVSRNQPSQKLMRTADEAKNLYLTAMN